MSRTGGRCVLMELRLIQQEILMEIAHLCLIASAGFVYVNAAFPSEECGVRRRLGRIVGGTDSGGYQYPWFALLVLKENTNVPVCAGSLITPYHVLTAAHCFIINPSVPKESLYKVLLGVYNRCKRREQFRQTFGVKAVHSHEGYESKKKFHDIALMTLDRRADFTVICLPSPRQRDLTEPAILIGFGVTREGGRRSPCRMLQANVTKYSKWDCSKTDLPAADVEEPTVICAGDTSGGIDSCQGDSGGPLQTVNASGKYVVTGIVSFGYGCAKPNLPGLYTDVSSYLDWIHGRMSDTGMGDSGQRDPQDPGIHTVPTTNVSFDRIPNDFSRRKNFNNYKNVDDHTGAVTFPKDK